MNIAWWVQRWSDFHPYKPVIIFEDPKITFCKDFARTSLGKVCKRELIETD